MRKVNPLGGGYSFDGLYERNTVGNSKISFIAADKIATGTVIVGLNLGGTAILLDGANTNGGRMIFYTGGTASILIGSPT